MDGLIAYALSKKYADEVGRSILDAGFKTQVEQDRSILQTIGQEKILYLIPKTTASPSDGYDEYVYSNNAWEQVGATDVDLSSYATKAEVGNLANLPTTDKSSIVSAISETFTSVSNGKSLVASAITDKGVSTSSDTTFEIMAQNIEAIPTVSPTVSNPALVLWDWEGTKLAGYSREDALALTELPAPSTLPAYATADHELLLFQEWNWSLANIKTWIQKHKSECLDVGAIYTTTDGQDHNYWGSPRLEGPANINMKKMGSTNNIPSDAFRGYNKLSAISLPYGVIDIGRQIFWNCVLKMINIPSTVAQISYSAFIENYALKQINFPNNGNLSLGMFQKCYSLEKVNIPNGTTDIGMRFFYECHSLKNIIIPSSVIAIGQESFYNCYNLPKIEIPDSVTSIGNSAFGYCSSLCDILLKGKPTLTNTNTFTGLPANYRIYVPRVNLSWFETETNWSTIYTQGYIVAIEDYIEYLESIGFNVDKYKEAA